MNRLSATLAQVGPDGEHFAGSKHASFLYRPFRVAYDDQMADSPFETGNGDILVWNGRLDNRDELLRLLSLENESPPIPAAKVVYLVLERWGIDGLPKLLGDFSLSLWQPALKRLLLATDVWGLRPLFYHSAPGFLAWASRCRSLVDALALPSDLDESYIAGSLTRFLPDDQSPFKQIRRVPPAHVLVAEGTDIRILRYWSPEPKEPSRDLDEGALQEQFLETFRQAVATRLKARSVVFSDLSGGFDSSSITCIAHDLISSGEVKTPGLRPVSYVYDQAKTSDERHYIGMVEDRLGSRGLHISNEAAPLLSLPSFGPQFRPDFPGGQLAYLSRNQHLANEMRASGSGVLLRGFGGDQVTWGDLGSVVWLIGDHVKRGRWRRAVGACHEWSRFKKTTFVSTLWRSGLWPLLPQWLRRRTPTFVIPLERWFDRDFARRLDLKSRLLGSGESGGFNLPSQRQQYTQLKEMSFETGWELLLSEGSVECRFPFLDRRLVELALSIPMDLMIRPGMTRSLARGALKEILPEKVRLRQSKSGPDEALFRTLAQRWDQLAPLLQEPRVVQYGFVDREAFRAGLQRARHGVALVSPQLLRTFALEIWLRSLESSPMDGPPN